MAVVAEIVLEELRRLTRLGSQALVAQRKRLRVGVEIGRLLPFGEAAKLLCRRRVPAGV